MFNLSAVLNFVGANTAGVRGAINQVQNKLDAGTKSAKTFSDAVALKGIQLSAYAVAGSAVIKLTESISRATSDAIRFEYELAKIAQTVNKTNAEVNSHADSIRQIAVSYGLSAPKIAETIRVLAQAGYSFKEAKASADSLAQTTLLASFESIADTTDGLIAINKQFIETMGDSARVLAVLNNVSKKYAVESSDLVEAVRKAGGVFSATGGTMEQLVTVFTTVRDTTRESAETIATGLRTIFSRLQRPKTIEYMRQFGIELTDLKGNFIGNYEAIQAIQKGIADQKISPKSTVFAGIVEEIGGIRQQSRVIPLLVQANKMQQIYQSTQTAGVDTALDLAKAQETLSFKIAQTQQNFARFISEVSSTDSFKSLISGLLGLTNAAINFASALKDLIPLITLMLAFKVGKSLSARIFGGAAGERKIPGFARGGFVPGTGSGDTVPAMLEPGEFVVNKASAQAIGYGNLHKINKYATGGRVGVQRFAAGGIVGGTLGGADAAISLLSDINPLVLKFGASLASASIQLNLAGQIGGSIGSIFKKIKVDLDAELAARNEFNDKLVKQTTKTNEALAAQSAAQEAHTTLLARGPVAPEILSRAASTQANSIASRYAKEAPVSGASDTQQADAGRTLATETGALITRIRSLGKSTEEETAAINGLLKVQSDLRRDNVASLVASRAYVDEIESTTLTLNDLQSASEKNVAIAKDYADAQVKRTNQLEKEAAANNAVPATGFRAGAKRLLGGLKEQGPQIATQAVAVATASLVTYMQHASDGAQKLADSAVEAGNSQEAYTQSLAASQAAAKAEAIQAGATLGATIGSLFGPFGTAIGGAIGAIVGWTGGITYMTDLLGLTNSELEAEQKAREQERNAALNASNKIVSDATKQASLFEKTDPDKAAGIMAKAVENHLKNVASQKTITNAGDKDVQEINRSLFDNLSQRIQALGQANSGKSKAELAALSPASAQLISEFDALARQIAGGSDAAQALYETMDATAEAHKKEVQAINDSIALELRQTAIRTSIERSLIGLDDSLTQKSQAIARLSFASGGGVQLGKATNLSDLSIRNVESSGFTTTLNNLAALGPQFATSVDKIKVTLSALGTGFTDQITKFRNAGETQKGGVIEDIKKYLESFGVDNSVITAAIRDIENGKTPSQVTDEIRSKELQSAVEGLQATNETLRADAEAQIQINQALSKAEEDRLSKVIEGTKAQDDINKKIRDISSVGLDPSKINAANYNAARASRLSSVGSLLAGTGLAGRQLTGGAEDLEAIGERLRITRELDAALKDQIQTLESVDPQFARLSSQQKALGDESVRLEKAMSALADTTEENEALQAQITQSQERRSQIRDAALEFASSDRAGKRQFVKTAFEANLVANTRNIGSIPQRDLAGVFSFLQKFRNSQIGNSGLTGQEVLNNAVKQIAIQTGSSLTAAEDLVANLTPIEAQALEQLKKNLNYDVKRNEILDDILSVLTKEAPENRTRNRLQAAQGFAAGGSIFKPRGTDTVPAMLTPGEFVMKRSAVQRIGVDNLHALNDGTSYLAEGGQPLTISQRRRAIILARKAARQNYFKQKRASRPGYASSGEGLFESTFGETNYQKPTRKQGPTTPEGIARRQASIDRANERAKKFKAERANLPKKDIIPRSQTPEGIAQAQRKRDKAERDAARITELQNKRAAKEAGIVVASSLSTTTPGEATLPKQTIEEYKKELQAERDKESAERERKSLSRQKASAADLQSILATGFTHYDLATPDVAINTDVEVAKAKNATYLAPFRDAAFLAGQEAIKARGSLPYQESGIDKAKREYSNFIKQQEYERSGVFKRPYGFNKGEESTKETFSESQRFIASRINDPKLDEDTPQNLVRKFQLLDEHRKSGGTFGLDILREDPDKPRTGTAYPSAPVLDNGPIGKTNDEVLRELALRAKKAKENDQLRIKNGGPTFDEVQKRERDKILFNLAEGRETARLIKEGKDNGGGFSGKTYQNQLGLAGLQDRYYRNNKEIANLPGKDTFFGIPHPKNLERSNPISSIASNIYENTKGPATEFNTGLGSILKQKRANSNFAYQPKTQEEIDKITAANREAFKNRFNSQARTRSYANGGDVVPAMLTPGEFVMNKRAVDTHGPLLRKLNSGGIVQGFARGGFVGGKTSYLEDGGSANGNMPSFDFSALEKFNSVFDASVSRLLAVFPPKIEVTLASEGINVNLNGAEFLAKIPDIIKVVTMETITTQMGNITESVKQNLSSGR